jgi:hypothetical protein
MNSAKNYYRKKLQLLARKGNQTLLALLDTEILKTLLIIEAINKLEWISFQLSKP